TSPRSPFMIRSSDPSTAYVAPPSSTTTGSGSSSYIPSHALNSEPASIGPMRSPSTSMVPLKPLQPSLPMTSQVVVPVSVRTIQAPGCGGLDTDSPRTIELSSQCV